MARFLFDSGFQELSVRVLERGAKVFVRHDGKDTEALFPLVQSSGDLDVLAQFFPSKITTNNGRTSQVNEMRGFVSMCGMPPLEVVVEKLRAAILLSSDDGKAKLNAPAHGRALLNALQATFPNGNQFARDLIDMNTIDLHLESVGPGLLLELTGELNFERLSVLYPSMASLLNHLGNLDISLIDMHAAGASPEAEVNTAKCMTRIRIVHKRGAIELHITMMLSAGGERNLLWFDRAKRTCVPSPDGNPAWAVYFPESGVNQSYSLRLVIDGAFRIPQLGCGSISLPLLVMEMKYSSSKSKFEHEFGGSAPAARFDITILHMTDKRMTALLLKPFFNLDLLRFILLTHFHIQIDILPPTKPRKINLPLRDGLFFHDEEEEEFFDAMDGQEDPQPPAGTAAHEEITITHKNKSKVLATTVQASTSLIRKASMSKAGYSAHWTFNTRLHMFMPCPPRVITSCLSLFIGEQMASPDDVQLIIDMMTALAKDINLMHLRLIRAEGDEAALKKAEEALKKGELAATEIADHVVLVEHRKSVQAGKKTKTSRKCCVVS